MERIFNGVSRQTHRDNSPAVNNGQKTVWHDPELGKKAIPAGLRNVNSREIDVDGGSRRPARRAI